MHIKDFLCTFPQHFTFMRSIAMSSYQVKKSEISLMDSFLIDMDILIP